MRRERERGEKKGRKAKGRGDLSASGHMEEGGDELISIEEKVDIVLEEGGKRRREEEGKESEKEKQKKKKEKEKEKEKTINISTDETESVDGEND